MPPSIRTCVGCRQRGPAAEMVRLRLQDGQIAIAPSGAVAGRGASIHPRALCVAGALKPGAFARAFKRPSVVAVIPPAAFLEQLTGASRNRKLGTP
ncbi:MAG TPA: YlxR family protein [Polyangia bacterium]